MGEEQFQSELRSLLVPFGFRVTVGYSLNDRYSWVRSSSWSMCVNAKGQWWDGERIYGTMVDEKDAGATPAQIARQILRDAYATIVQPAPQAPECDWRPQETLPEDYYA